MISLKGKGLHPVYEYSTWHVTCHAHLKLDTLDGYHTQSYALCTLSCHTLYLCAISRMDLVSTTITI